MKNEMIVPTEADYQSMDGKAGAFAAAQCMSSCRGCQCHVNTMSVEDIFSDVIAPLQIAYDKMVDAIKTNVAFSAGGCTCNCTACNSCNCACSCRSYAMVGEEAESIWA